MVCIVGSLQGDPSPDLEAALGRRRKWQQGVLEQAARHVPEMAAPPDWIAQLLLAADTFMLARRYRTCLTANRSSPVIPGWDWGRDTMIRLPGLTLATGRSDIARDVLLTFARFVSQGMLPNVFPGAGDEPDYNTADASLWFFEAWRAYIDATGDIAALRTAFPASRHDRLASTGTRYGIVVDPADGLLRAGQAGVQLTWMDAKLGDWVVTPRIGKPVEINALWHSVVHMAGFAGMLDRPADPYRTLPNGPRQSFARFTDERTGGRPADTT